MQIKLNVQPAYFSSIFNIQDVLSRIKPFDAGKTCGLGDNRELDFFGHAGDEQTETNRYSGTSYF